MKEKDMELSKKRKKVYGILFIILLIGIILSSIIIWIIIESNKTVIDAKPVIYFYPEKKMDISIKLDYNGELFVTYPKYEEGWNITAYPDGKIISDGKEYSYIFWDGFSEAEYDFSKGFVVKGEDTENFLREKLQYLGLLPHEYNEFIVYWLPKMINNKYNLITFQDEEYISNARLEIEPKPDSIQRVFMAYKALNNYIEIEEQELKPFERKGYAVIEWGGSEVK